MAHKRDISSETRGTTEPGAANPGEFPERARVAPALCRSEPEAAGSGSLLTALAELNRIVHEPARLAILTVLNNCESADFTFLENVTGLTKGNLWVQLARLEKESLISVEKVSKKTRTITRVRILAEGRHQLTRYWSQMEEIRGCASSASAVVNPTDSGAAGGRSVIPPAHPVTSVA